MIVLGLAAFVHDSGASLVRDGKLVAHAEEERFNRVQHTDAFPAHALAYVLKEGGITLADVDIIAFNWNPYRSLAAEVLKALCLPVTYYKVYKFNRPPKNFRSIIASLLLKRALRKQYPRPRFRGRIVWVDHHRAHAASAYYLSPFSGRNADIIVIDGHGDDCSASVYSVAGTTFTLRWQIPIFDSLGILYANFTRFLGFGQYQEGKTMALASFGQDSFSSLFEGIVVLKPEGRYEVNRDYLALWKYLGGELEGVLGKHRERDEPLEQRHFDLACSMQNRVKDAILHTIRHLSTTTGNRNLGLAGGVFLNCDINRHILNSMAYREVFIPPFPSDSGGAPGAALYAAHAASTTIPAQDPWFSPYLGPAYGDGEIENALGQGGLVWEKVEAPWVPAAQALHENKTVGWFQGRMECGPRALGNRSILANPTGSGIQDYLNSRIKKREYFRPFAPIVTEDAAVRYFDLEEPLPLLARYMLVTASVRTQFRAILPGITHVDGTARLQVVTREGNREMYELLREFEKVSDYAVLINTSFNCGEPIVCSPADAVRTYCATGLDMLVIGRYVVRKC